MARRRRRRARRNPARLSLRGIQGQLGDAAALSAGLIGVTFALNLIPIPAQLRTGWTRHITKGAVGLGLGWAVSQVNREWGKWVSLGALSAVVVDVVNDFSAQSGMLALPSPRTGVAGLGGFPAYEEGAGHYTGYALGHYTGVEGLGVYGAYE